MNGMEVTKELKCDIELNQTQLKAAICNHQNTLAKLELDSSNADLQKEVNRVEEEIITIGLEQKNLLERLRDEYKAYQKSLKTNLIKNGLEERRFNLTNALNRARKQTIVVRSGSATSYSDDSTDNVSLHSSPEHHHACPVDPRDVPQTDFLNYFCLATHDQYKEMQNKRAERKRRSTANPQFLYGNKGWDFLTHNKRRRNAFLVSASPPHTRQSAKRRQGRATPPPPAARTPPPTQRADQQVGGATQEAGGADQQVGGADQHVDEADQQVGGANQPVLEAFPAIPQLPSGLIIERVGQGGGSPDSKSCITCKQPGALSVREICMNGFHIGCHNRPLTHTPRQCPKCMSKETRTVGALTVPSGMSVSYVSPPPEVTEKLNKKRELEEKRQTLSAELTQLQNRHSQLTISLREQQNQQDQLQTTRQSTEDKIEQILAFISNIQKTMTTAKVFDDVDKDESKVG